ncbi:MAG: serine hydrolase [Candidatus Sumerlaeia bacterium]|nr:serine hydrolase [Candidatus Sumerlaeia bacterium]
MTLEKKLAELDRKLHGKFGICVEWLETGERWGLRADEAFATASVIKVQIMTALFERVKRDKLDLSTRMVVKRRPGVTGAGVLRFMTVGTEITLRDLCILMIILSDNVATNMLIEFLGLKAINASIRSWGYEKTVLNRPINFRPEKRVPFNLAETTPAETNHLLARIARREMLGRKLDAEMERIMTWQKFDTALPRYLPNSGNWRDDAPEFVVAHKTGSISQVRNDVGIVTSPAGRYAISVFTKDLRDNSYHPDNEGVVGIAQVHREVWKFLERRHGRTA